MNILDNMKRIKKLKIENELKHDFAYNTDMLATIKKLNELIDVVNTLIDNRKE